MSNLERRPSGTPRRAREQRAYRLVVTGGPLGLVAAVGFVLAIVGVLGWGVPILALVLAVVCGLLFPAHGLLGPLRRLRHRFLPRHLRADIRDQELLAELLEATLEPSRTASTWAPTRRRAGAHGPAGTTRPPRRLGACTAARATAVRALAGRRRQAGRAVRPGRRARVRARGRRPGLERLLARPSPGGGPVETISVRCERLDDALPDELRPAFVKIDVEGAGSRCSRRRRDPPPPSAARRLRARLRLGRPLRHRCGGRARPALRPRLRGRGPRRLDGPYSRERFAELFASGERVNFLARPGGEESVRGRS